MTTATKLIRIENRGGGYQTWVMSDQGVEICIGSLTTTIDEAQTKARESLADKAFMTRFGDFWGKKGYTFKKVADIK